MMTLLILAIVVLLIVAIARIVRIVELANELSGEDDSVINENDNKFNGRMLFFILFATIGYFGWVTMKYKQFILPESASEHGLATDQMLWTTFAIIISVFFITQILLFTFAFKYSHDKSRRGHFFPDNHKLEILWTALPTVVLITLVGYGLMVWNKITAPAPADSVVIEVYGKQFDWTVRYGGKDNNLGSSNFRLITDNNVLGMDYTDEKGKDDIVVKELHLPVNKDVLLVLHSRDVIHSAYLPHFRTQMNCVPGMSTQFHFKPRLTTAEMRKITKNEKFDYVLLCNKVCGVAHYNMALKVVCDSPEEYAAWMKSQKTVVESMSQAAEPAM